MGGPNDGDFYTSGIHKVCCGDIPHSILRYKSFFIYDKGDKVLGQLKYWDQYVTDPELLIHMDIVHYCMTQKLETRWIINFFFFFFFLLFIFILFKILRKNPTFDQTYPL